jgi:hypothetical protein
MPPTGEDRARQTTESFASTLEKLIRRFESDRPHYLSKGYSEAQARVDFVTPFFKALGWDVENQEGLPHHAREVVVEAAEDTGGRPDYGFRVAGQTKFFVEAKAILPSISFRQKLMPGTRSKFSSSFSPISKSSASTTPPSDLTPDVPTRGCF